MREHYKEHGDIDMALRNFPRHLVAEKAIVSVVLFLHYLTWNYLKHWLFSFYSSYVM